MDDLTEEERAATDEWMRSRPESVQALMLRFPPASTVRGKRPLVCPRPGGTATVVGYCEPEPDSPSGMIIVTGESLFGPVKTYCRPDDVELVSTAFDSVERVARVIGGEGTAAVLVSRGAVHVTDRAQQAIERARAAIVALHRGELRVPRTVLITEGCRTYAATEEEWEEIRRRREERR